MNQKISLGTNNNPNILIINEITKSCEKLITETQCDIEIFRNQQKNLQKQIHEIQEENSRFNSKLDVLKSSTANNTGALAGDSRDDATREKLTNDAFKNVKKQIDYLQSENNDLRSLNKTSQKNIENLEKEIQNYRNQLFKPTSVCEVKQKYTTAIKLLESSILDQKSELKDQTQIIENLFEQKKQLRDLIENLQKSIEEKDQEISNQAENKKTIARLQEQVTETVLHNKELKKSLKISQHAIEERFKREQSALQKVQEALTIAEAAVADKEEALKRERVLREECDNIASTIGQVMDEAARNVENDLETIRKKFLDKEKTITEEKNKISEELQNQKKLNHILDTRCNRFDLKLKDARRENENLSHQLELAAKAMYDMEEKLNRKDSMQSSEAPLQKRTDDQEFEIQHFVETNKQLKDKYRLTLHDLTKKFEQEIYRLQNEVSDLKAENQVLKLETNYVVTKN